VRPRLLAAIVFGLAAYGVTSFIVQLGTSARCLVGWNAGALLYLGLAWHEMRGVDDARLIQSRAVSQDEGQKTVLLLVVVAAAAVLFAVGTQLAQLKELDEDAAGRGWHLALAGATVLTSWFFTQLLHRRTPQCLPRREGLQVPHRPVVRRHFRPVRQRHRAPPDRAGRRIAAPIDMLVSSPGGHLESGDAIHDIIRFIGAPVNMIGTGWVGSAATHLYLSVPRERRFCTPNTRFLIHQPSGGAGGPASDIAIHAQEIIKARERIAARSRARPGGRWTACSKTSSGTAGCPPRKRSSTDWSAASSTTRANSSAEVVG
jgi:hypothetical protein